MWSRRISSISVGKKGEMMMGWVSLVLTTWPKTSATPVDAGIDEDEDKAAGDEEEAEDGGGGMMTPEETASETTAASSTFRRFSSSYDAPGGRIWAERGRLEPHD
jgi:hypothetical protein